MRKFRRIAHTDVREQLDGRAVQIFAAVFGITRALQKPACEEVADGPTRVYPANVIYLRTRRRAAVEHDGEYLKTSIPDFLRKFARVRLLGGGRGMLRYGERNLRISLDKREPCPLEACGQRRERFVQFRFFHLQERGELVQRERPSLAKEKRFCARHEVVLHNQYCVPYRGATAFSNSMVMSSKRRSCVTLALPERTSSSIARK